VVVASDRPDGDVELAEDDVESFTLVECEACGSDMLKPDVVFFGENVPRERVDRCYALVEDAATLLVVGSSLTVMSGLRFVHRAERKGIPVAIVNRDHPWRSVGDGADRRSAGGAAATAPTRSTCGRLTGERIVHGRDGDAERPAPSGRVGLNATTSRRSRARRGCC
jgi:NAD-dependent SIR2 family protein deacetylase